MSAIHLAGRSKWTFSTSGGGGLSIDVVAASGGTLEFNDPNRQPVRFHFGALGAGLGFGVKIPKLGGLIGKLLSSRSVSGSGSTFAMRNEGVIFQTDVTRGRELTRGDFTGVCVIGEIGGSTPLYGLSGTVYLFNINKLTLALMLTNSSIASTQMALGLIPPLTPSAVLLADGDTRGLGLGVAGYLGYVW